MVGAERRNYGRTAYSGNTMVRAERRNYGSASFIVHKTQINIYPYI
jgi:hypothetical protein